MVETNVHYPTDINLLLDAIRKVISLTAHLCETNKITDWRQYKYNYRSIKKLMRIAQDKKRGKPKLEEKKKQKEEELKESHQNYMDACSNTINKAIISLNKIRNESFIVEIQKQEIIKFINHAKRQIDQIKRRVIQGEVIPHEEKVFSIFEPHTEWISKGKAGVPVELGLKVCVVEDQHQFILHHQVMEHKTDNQVCVSVTKETKERFSTVRQASFDKGFYSAQNQEALKNVLEMTILPRKGKLSKQARELETSVEFRQARRQHSAIESAINALEVHGLDYCPDHGISGFKRYISLSIVARNIQRTGAILQVQEQKINRRNRKKFHARYVESKMAA